jgi:quercetin dioxygenase-like cupin family protein
VFAEMQSSGVLARLATTDAGPTLDCFGGYIQILSKATDFWVLRGIVPPGSVVPMHSHDDAEDFFILSGSQQVLVGDGDDMTWVDATAGDYIRVPGQAVHAHRNVTDRPAIDLVVTTARLGRFFEEIGRPITADHQPPTDEEVAAFVEKSIEYGYQLATPEENAAYGIELPIFAG